MKSTKRTRTIKLSEFISATENDATELRLLLERTLAVLENPALFDPKSKEEIIHTANVALYGYTV